MNGPIRRLAIALFVGFAVLLVNVTYLQAIAADRYRDDPRNPRVAAALTGKERGLIVTADGTPVAISVANPNDPSRFIRRYPAGATYAHTVGYSSLLFGDEGLERVYAEELRSKRDLTLSDVIAALFGRDLRPKSLQLTLDAGLQQASFDALGGRRGAIVALRPSTGEVLAMVSSPGFDPASLLGPDAADVRSRLLDDPDEPLLNRAIGRTYPPASTFKVVVASAAVETGLAGPDSLFPDPTEVTLPSSTATIRNYDRGPCVDGTQVTLDTAFRRSCNTIFAMLGMELGAATLAETAQSFGFGIALPLELPVQPSVFPTDLDEAALAQSAIGQRDVRATPFEMAAVAATVANGGLLMRPYLVQRVVDADGADVAVTEPEILARVVSPATAAIVAEMMEGVVASGTGTKATVPNVRVAGKTGTAENDEGPPDVWFIAFAPVEAPTIALAVLIEGGGDAGENATGGSVAAPVARQVLEYWLQDRR